jgi:monoamine oxidase
VPATLLGTLQNFVALLPTKKRMMWSSVKTEKEEDYRFEDLRQENATLRNELSQLYDTLLTSADNRVKHTDVTSSQTDNDMILTYPEVAEKFKLLENEVAHQRLLINEQAQRAKEGERKIRDLEAKVLEKNVELLRCEPIKARADELQQQNEQLQAKLSFSTMELSNCSVEVAYLKAAAEHLRKDLTVKDTELAQSKADLQTAHNDIRGKAKKLRAG